MVANSFAEVSRQVSFDDENLILVDARDNVIGHDSKDNVHQGSGLLHRAFSIFLFDGPDRVLLHRRSGQKRLWPGFWTNSCCSHPRRSENYASAARRRLLEELGVTAELSWLYQFQYAASYRNLGAERELCAVLIGDLERPDSVRANRNEVQEWGWFACDEVDRWVQRQPGQFTPWFLLEWSRLRGDQRAAVDRHCRRGNVQYLGGAPSSAPPG